MLATLFRGNDRGATTLRLLSCASLVATTVGLGALGFGTAANAAPPDKVTICHATGAANNPYIINKPDKSADVGGHNVHNAPVYDVGAATWGDIIPIFTYVDGNGVTQTYPGMNWAGNTLAQEIYANSCNMVTPDLRLLKTSSGPAAAGTSGTYTLAVRNVGTRTATGPLTVSDTFPAGVVATGYASADWTCTLGAAGASISCTGPASLAPATSTSDIVIDVDWVTEGSKVNSATVGTVTHEVVTANNTGRNTTRITGLVLTPDLALTKTTTGNAVVGTSGEYYIDVENVGDAAAVGPFTVTDTMPADVVATAASGNGWVCTLGAAGASISCDHAADLAAGAVAGRITVDVDWNGTGVKSNTAQVSAVLGDTALGNNEDTVQSTVTAAPVPDLQLLKTSSTGAVAGGTGSYFVDVDNVGGGVANGPFTVSDTLPSGVVATAASGAGWTCTVPAGGASFSCDHAANLAGNTSAGLITVSVNWMTSGAKNNRATVTTVTNEVQTANNTDDVDTTVAAVIIPPPPNPTLTPDLAIKKAGPASAVPGDAITWTLTVTSKGTGAASGFTVTDTVPSGVTLTSLSGAGFACTLSTAVCTHAGSLAPGSSAVITAVGDLSSTFGGTSIANTAVVGPPDGTADNTDTVVTVVRQPQAQPGPADLSIEKSAADELTAPGEDVSWALTVTNVGESDAALFSVTDELGDGLSLVSIAGEGFDCDGATCTYGGSLAPGDSVSLTVTTALDDGWTLPSVTNAASVALEEDPTIGNNNDTALAGVALPIDGGTEEPATGEPTPEPLPSQLPFTPEPETEAPLPSLPFTGAATDVLLALGAGLSVLGLLLALTGRRRRTAP